MLWQSWQQELKACSSVIQKETESQKHDTSPGDLKDVLKSALDFPRDQTLQSNWLLIYISKIKLKPKSNRLCSYLTICKKKKATYLWKNWSAEDKAKWQCVLAASLFRTMKAGLAYCSLLVLLLITDVCGQRKPRPKPVRPSTTRKPPAPKKPSPPAPKSEPEPQEPTDFPPPILGPPSEFPDCPRECFLPTILPKCLVLWKPQPQEGPGHPVPHPLPVPTEQLHWPSYCRPLQKLHWA